MGKDPAMLWYWGDWFSGTSTYTRFQKGCYMDLLHAQFNNGPLSLEEIKTVLGSDFSVWGTIQKKFKQTEDGLFFNERLELEKEKRKKFTESRRRNLKKPHMEPHMGTHMEPHMENENENEYSIYSKDKTKEMFFSDFKVIEWCARERGIGKDQVKDLMTRFWDKQDVANKITTRSYSDFRDHFMNTVPKMEIKEAKSETKKYSKI